MDGVRNTCAIRIEALETAIIETKIKCGQEVNRAEMKLSEMESYLLSQ